MRDGDDRTRVPVGDLFSRVVDDARNAAAAELTVIKAVAAWRLSGLKLGVPLLLGALFLLQAVITALLVGAILALATLVGPGWATLIVFAVGAAIVGLLVWMGVRRCSTLFSPLPGEGA